MTAEFPSVDAATWRARVQDELKGKDFERALVHQALGGLSIQPLYTETPVEPAPPGHAPYLRGGQATPDQPRSLPRFRQPDLTEAAEHLRLARQRGADGGWMCLSPRARGRQSDGPGLPLVDEASVARLLGDASAGWWVFDAGLEAEALHHRLADGFGDAVWLGGDPMGSTLRDGADAARRAAAEQGLAALMGSLDGSERRAGLVSTLPLHEAGADPVLELAYLCAALVHRLRAADAAGIAPATVAGQTGLQLAVQDDVFLAMAQLRAARRLHAEVMGACGVKDVPPAIHAVTSPRSLSRHDPWVNMLRVTTQTFAAIGGGAELITPLCFDEAVGRPDALGYRVARNTMNVLRDESALGWVVDPAGGSHYVEALSRELVERGYARFQAIERAGGLPAYVDGGELRAAIDAAWAERSKRLVRRKLPRTGVSEFASVDEKALTREPWPREDGAGLPRRRDDAPFEALRAATAATPPVVYLANLGPLAEHKARATFSASLFAAGGLRCADGEGTGDADPDEAAAALAAGRPDEAAVACLCGTDERYASHAEAAARALKKAGVKRLVFAGRPPAQMEGSLREAGVDDFIFLGGDVEAALRPMIEAYGLTVEGDDR